MSEKTCCCNKANQREEDIPKSSCCGSKEGDATFLASLDEEMRALLLDSSTAPELVNSGEEIFSAYQNQTLPEWTKGLWELYKEIIRSTIDGGWDNDVHPWNREMQDFWKYPIAFTSYGLPSLVMTDPSTYEEACEILRKSIQLMKDAGAFDEWTRLEFGKDPVTTKNVMYKGHLNLMYGLYQLLTGSTEFEEEYKHLNQIITRESFNNSQNFDFWGIECEPDQYFPPCNAVGLMSLKIYDLNFGTNYEKELCLPTANFIREKMVDPETGINFYRYHPSHDYAEPYVAPDCWTISMLHYFSPDQTEKAMNSVKKEFLCDLKGGKECYLKADRYTDGASTDYEQSTLVLYVPFASREIPDPILWEKINRFMNDMYEIKLVEGVVRFTDADPTIETHAAGYLLLGAVHLGWKKIIDFDWKKFREEHKEK